MKEELQKFDKSLSTLLECLSKEGAFGGLAREIRDSWERIQEMLEARLCPNCGEEMHCPECQRGVCYEHVCDNPPI